MGRTIGAGSNRVRPTLLALAILLPGMLTACWSKTQETQLRKAGSQAQVDREIGPTPTSNFCALGTSLRSVAGSNVSLGTAVGVDVASDGNGRMYIVGQDITTDSQVRWAIQRSSDGGATWQPSDRFHYEPGGARWGRTEARQAVILPNGHVYVIGNASLPPAGQTDAPTSRWIVRKSTDYGVTWTTVDDFDGGGRGAQAFQIMRDSQNTVYVGGQRTVINGTLTYTRSVIRVTEDGGTSWTLGEDYLGGNTEDEILVGSHSSTFRTMAIDSNGHIYTWLTRRTNGTSEIDEHVIKRSTDNTVSWSVVGSFPITETVGYPSQLLQTRHQRYLITPDRHLIILERRVVPVADLPGATAPGSTTVVRLSTDLGATWMDADEYSLEDMRNGIPFGITVDARGHIYYGWHGFPVLPTNETNTDTIATSQLWHHIDLAGNDTIVDPLRTLNIVLRKSIDGGRTWTLHSRDLTNTTDVWGPGAGLARLTGLSSDPRGGVYAVAASLFTTAFARPLLKLDCN